MQYAKNLLKATLGSGGSSESAPAASAIINPPADAPPVVAAKVTLVDTLVGHEERVWSAAWHPTEPILATCSSDKSVRLWSPSTADGAVKWKSIGTLEGEHGRTVRQVAWSPDGSMLAAASFDATVSIWRKASPQFEMEVDGVLDGHENEVKSVAWDQTGRCLATCSRDKSVWIWDRGTQDEEDEEPQGEFECAAVLTGHSQDVKSVRWVPHSRVLMSCGYDDTIKVWEESRTRKDDWHCTKTLAQHESTVWQIAFQRILDPKLAEACIMLSASDDCTVGVWRRGTDAADGGDPSAKQWTNWTKVNTMSGVHNRTVYSVDFAPPLPGVQCSTLFAIGAGDDSFSIHSIASKDQPFVDGRPQPYDITSLHREDNAHEADVNCVTWCPQPIVDAATGEASAEAPTYMLATCGDDGVVKLWKVQPQKANA